MGKNEAQIKYRKKAVKTLYLDMNLKTDADILKWLENALSGNKSHEIKFACRQQIPKKMKPEIMHFLCPNCERIYTPVEIQTRLFAFCPYCGQKVMQIPDDDSAPVESGDSAPADTKPGTSAPVKSGDSAPADTEALKKAKAYAGKGETYLINYVLKRGKQELQREAIIRGYTKKGAIQNFRKWHEETKEGGEGHAFRPTATRKWGKNGLDPLTTPEAEAIPQIYGESAEQWEQDAQEFWRKVDAEIAADAKKEES